MNDRLRHHYRKYRDHQRKLMAEDRGGLTTYANGRTELSYGGAPYGEHALSAYWAARGFVAFLDRMKEELRK